MQINITKTKEKGSAMFVAMMVMLSMSLLVVNGVAGPVFRDTKIIQESNRSKHSLSTAESGLEDVILRVKNGMTYDTVEVLSVGDSKATTTTTVLPTSDVSITSEGDTRFAIRKTNALLEVGEGVAFNYGVQAGNGGIVLENSSSVLGNVSSNGSVIGSGSNLIQGTVISAGPNGLIEGIHATSSVYANSIDSIESDGDAYYQTIADSTIHGTLYPGSTDQDPNDMPITDEQIESWKDIAVLGGVINSPCPYEIDSETTIGPVKINCDVEISGNNFTVNLAGNVWVDGNIVIRNGPTIRVDDSMSGNSIAIIADNDSDRENSGLIELQNSAVFEGNGSRSYILLISKNSSASSGGDLKAIEVKNTVEGDLLVYAGEGEILLQNSVDLKEVTAYRIRLKNSAQVIYDTGLANLLFDSGPGGGFSINGWSEI